MQTGQHAKAFQLFLKPLKFNVATAKGAQLLDKIIDLYKTNGLSEGDINKMRAAYEAIGQRFDQRMAEMKKQELSSSKKLDRIGEISKESGKEIDALFVQFPPLRDRI